MEMYPYTWAWAKWPRSTWSEAGIRKGQPCRVLARSTRMNSVLVEFEDGERVITSANGLRKAPQGT